MVYCFIQARMGSLRLPGKVLKNICEKPVLQHIIERVKYSKFTDKIIVATSTNQENNAIEKLCNKLYIPCFRGSEDDVLARFKGAIKEFDIKPTDSIIRICCDCPLADPDLIDSMLNIHKDNDFTSNCIERTYPDGLDIEIFKASVLDSLDFNKFNPFELDYNIDSFKYTDLKIHSMKQTENMSHFRWTLDTSDDFKFIKNIYEKLYKPGKIFLMEDILNEVNTWNS